MEIIMVIGITGGIGAGKSTVLKLLKDKFGFTVIEADQVAKDLMKQGTAVYQQVAERFGKEIVGEDGAFDRKKLAAVVFQDKEKLAVLNGLVHPAVMEEIRERIASKKAEGIDRFVIEAALLIESGCNRLCDRVWYIDTAENVRIRRLKEGRGMSEEQIAAVMKNQLPRDTFLEVTDTVVDNSFSVENTEEQIQKLLEV